MALRGAVWPSLSVGDRVADAGGAYRFMNGAKLAGASPQAFCYCHPLSVALCVAGETVPPAPVFRVQVCVGDSGSV